MTVAKAKTAKPAATETVIVIKGRKVVGGVTEGEALVTTDTISGWGGGGSRSASAFCFL